MIGEGCESMSREWKIVLSVLAVLIILPIIIMIASVS